MPVRMHPSPTAAGCRGRRRRKWRSHRRRDVRRPPRGRDAPASTAAGPCRYRPAATWPPWIGRSLGAGTSPIELERIAGILLQVAQVLEPPSLDLSASSRRRHSHQMPWVTSCPRSPRYGTPPGTTPCRACSSPPTLVRLPAAMGRRRRPGGEGRHPKSSSPRARDELASPWTSARRRDCLHHSREASG